MYQSHRYTDVCVWFWHESCMSVLPFYITFFRSISFVFMKYNEFCTRIYLLVCLSCHGDLYHLSGRGKTTKWEYKNWTITICRQSLKFELSYQRKTWIANCVLVNWILDYITLWPLWTNWPNRSEVTFVTLRSYICISNDKDIKELNISLSCRNRE